MAREREWLLRERERLAEPVRELLRRAVATGEQENGFCDERETTAGGGESADGEGETAADEGERVAGKGRGNGWRKERERLAKGGGMGGRGERMGGARGQLVTTEEGKWPAKERENGRRRRDGMAGEGERFASEGERMAGGGEEASATAGLLRRRGRNSGRRGAGGWLAKGERIAGEGRENRWRRERESQAKGEEVGGDILSHPLERLDGKIAAGDGRESWTER